MAEKNFLRKVEDMHRQALATVAAVASGLALAACASRMDESTASGAPKHSHAQKNLKEGVRGCGPWFNVNKYRQHQYEACTSYVVNSSEVALQGMYKYGNNASGTLSGVATHHFDTRYWSAARQAVDRRVQSWTQTHGILGNEVDESIYVKNVSSNLAADRAVVNTKESWLVTSPSGQVLYKQNLQDEDATLCRGRETNKILGAPYHFLLEWVVVSFSASPHYDCLAFDRNNGLVP